MEIYSVPTPLKFTQSRSRFFISSGGDDDINNVLARFFKNSDAMSTCMFLGNKRKRLLAYSNRRKVDIRNTVFSREHRHKLLFFMVAELFEFFVLLGFVKLDHVPT